jgi:hypothetical protein
VDTPCSTALVLSLLAAPAAAQADSDCECHAANARYNASTAPKTGYDFVPIVPDDSLGFYVVYSARQDDSGTGIGSTANIYVLPLEDEEVLVFGSGWGNTAYAGWALYDADYDVAHVDQVVRYCLGLDPARVRLRFFGPHAHPDHINAAFIKALERAGYTLAEIAFHEGDRATVESLPWFSHHLGLFHVLGALPCGRELASFPSPLGRIWFTPRPGHTPGSIDLVLDVRGDPAERVLVRGSLPGGACAPPGGVVLELGAHGTVVVNGHRRAQVSELVGRGLNRICLGSADSPILGTLWSAEVDNAGHPGATFACLLGSDCRLDPGVVMDVGELLIDPARRQFLTVALAGSGGIDRFDIPIPNDPSLLGTTCYVQASVLGGKPELCNALELVIGL